MINLRLTAWHVADVYEAEMAIADRAERTARELKHTKQRIYEA
jgi:hypothetical protein